MRENLWDMILEEALRDVMSGNRKSKAELS